MSQPAAQLKRGRRRGGEDTREVILAAARELFANSTFEGVSLRQIARQAGVDPALIHHYFDSKDQLFTACIQLPADPLKVLAGVAQTAPERRAEALLKAILELWESPARPALLALANSAINSPARASLIRQVMSRLLLPHIIDQLPGDSEQRQLRGNLVISQVLGLIMARHVIKIEPLASASTEQLIRLTTPTIQHYLTGELEAVSESG